MKSADSMVSLETGAASDWPSGYKVFLENLLFTENPLKAYSHAAFGSRPPFLLTFILVNFSTMNKLESVYREEKYLARYSYFAKKSSLFSACLAYM